MKWLIVIGIFVLGFGYIFYRFRNQIKTAYMMWYAFRQLRGQIKSNQPKGMDKPKHTGNEELIHCPTCGKWVSKSEAVKLKSKYYCSLQCMENSLTKVG